MHNNFIYFNSAQCVIKSNVKDFLDYRKFPKNNRVSSVKVEWDEDWSYKHNFEGITTPYFIKSFNSFDQATSFVYRLMAGFISSVDLKKHECEIYEDMANSEGDYCFKKVARVVLEVQFENSQQ